MGVVDIKEIDHCTVFFRHKWCNRSFKKISPPCYCVQPKVSSFFFKIYGSTFHSNKKKREDKVDDDDPPASYRVLMKIKKNKPTQKQASQKETGLHYPPPFLFLAARR